MKRTLQLGLLIVSGSLLLLVAAVWAWSFRAPHSLRYSRACGEFQLLIDRGLIQIDLVRGDTEDRGFEWDSHRRSAGWGRAELEMFMPKVGIGKFFADFGFATWSYTRSLQMIFGPNLPGRVFFFPFWFLALFPISALVWHGWRIARHHRSIISVERPAALRAAVALL